MKNLLAGLLATVALLWSGPALAHFQVLVPSADIVDGEGNAAVDLQILFTHPMEWGPVMEMARPRRFGVLAGGERKNLLKSLKAKKLDGKTAYEATYKPRRPGDHVFYLEPAPYWEPAEGKMIVHYTKVVVNAFGAEKGWDEMVGFPVEIEPLVRPYGLWAGNLFRGIVRKNGKPLPYAEIEVEYYNEGGRVKIPAGPFATQVVKADGGGVFSYAMPRAGWWAFAALVKGKEKLKNPEGRPVEVELGGLLWVKTTPMR